MTPDGGYSRPSAKAGGRFVFCESEGTALLSRLRRRAGVGVPPRVPLFVGWRYSVSGPIFPSDVRWGRTMTRNARAPTDQLWRSLRHEAESTLASDPIFGVSLTSAILDHPDFASALSRQIGERLGKTPAERQMLARVSGEAFAATPDLVDAATRDLQSIAIHDPAPVLDAMRSRPSSSQRSGVRADSRARLPPCA